eukprot:7680903-Pyramimonas_sp.AAC.1
MTGTNRGPSSSSRPSSDLWMPQTNAPDHSASVHVCISSVARARDTYRKPTVSVEMTRAIQIVVRT